MMTESRGDAARHAVTLGTPNRRRRSPGAALPVRSLLTAMLCVATVGCKEPAAPAGHTAVPPSDATILLALDYYEPVYKVDADGRITRLRLAWRHLPTPVMAEIGKLTELRALEFYGASVTDDGLAQLRDLQKLRSMGLGRTPITDDGLVHLEKLRSLQWLWLSKESITEAGVERLKAARPDMNVYRQ